MISNRDRSFLARAITIAEQGTERHRHGAIVVKGGRVIGLGVNTFRNHANNVTNPARESSYHAEINAMGSASVKGATVYVARLTRTDRVGVSKPCFNCYTEMIERGVKRVIWTGDEGTYGVNLPLLN